MVIPSIPANDRTGSVSGAGNAPPPLTEGPGGATLDDIVRLFHVEEIIFCSKDMSAAEIIRGMMRIGPRVSYKIVPEGSSNIIGSSNKNEPGELYTTDVQYNIAQPGQRRNKRVFDIGACLLLLITLPLWLLLSTSRRLFLKNWWGVFTAKKTWVGYAPGPHNAGLPRLVPGVFSPLAGFSGTPLNEGLVARLNFIYARDWNVWKDAEVLRRVIFGA